ncbi:hypothetical protein CYMTET_34958 [Cymbomonas tetramitiformis]|uniref:Uncharacterized protein n=1 Tax=Cymbomonas tetramitiformis TaxID=36881 RepID=A0AAE0FA45_9CHLO|nr:hypothetical protein CYMTET_34958 [Cymbomonas tetramitiformis]
MDSSIWRIPEAQLTLLHALYRVGASKSCVVSFWKTIQDELPFKLLTIAAAAQRHNLENFGATLQVRQPITGKLLFNLAKHKGAVTICKLDPACRYFATCSADTTIKIWDVSLGAENYSVNDMAQLSLTTLPHVGRELPYEGYVHRSP